VVFRTWNKKGSCTLKYTQVQEVAALDSESSADADSDTEKLLAAKEPPRPPSARPHTKASTHSSFRPSTTRSGVSGLDEPEEAELPLKVSAAPNQISGVFAMYATHTLAHMRAHEASHIPCARLCAMSPGVQSCGVSARFRAVVQIFHVWGTNVRDVGGRGVKVAVFFQNPYHGLQHKTLDQS
jgi:hypothetical protein